MIKLYKLQTKIHAAPVNMTNMAQATGKLEPTNAVLDERQTLTTASLENDVNKTTTLRFVLFDLYEDYHSVGG